MIHCMPKERHVWADAVRGFCVLAVVIFHVCAWHYLTVAPPNAPVTKAWDFLNNILGSLRMPVLLGVSGIFAARRIRLGWRDPAFLTRAGNSYYLYVIWLSLLAIFYALTASVRLPHAFIGIQESARELVAPTTPLWFIFALAVYTAVLASVASVPPKFVIGALTVLSLTISFTGDLGFGLAAKVPHYFIFFAIGVYCAQWLQERARSCSAASLTGFVVLQLVLSALSLVSLPALVEGAIMVARGASALVLAFVIAGRLANSVPRVAGAAAYFGQRTLQIYVVHILLVLAVVFLTNSGWGASVLERVLSSPVMAALYPLALTSVVVALCLMTRKLMAAVGLVFFFDPPAWIESGLSNLHRKVIRTRQVTGTGRHRSTDQ